MKPRKRINPISAARKTQLNVYAKLKKDWFVQNPTCVRCGNRASEVHHRFGRTNDLLCWTEGWVSLCRSCHTFIHNNRKWAIDNKWLASGRKWNSKLFASKPSP